MEYQKHNRWEVRKGFIYFRGWFGDAMVLGELPVPGRPTVWITVGQVPKTTNQPANQRSLQKVSPDNVRASAVLL